MRHVSYIILLESSQRLLEYGHSVQYAQQNVLDSYSKRVGGNRKESGLLQQQNRVVHYQGTVRKNRYAEHKVSVKHLWIKPFFIIKNGVIKKWPPISRKIITQYIQCIARGDVFGVNTPLRDRLITPKLATSVPHLLLPSTP